MSTSHSSRAPRIAAVVFDWRGTLVTELDSRGWVREALRLARRECDGPAVDAVLRAIHTPELLSRLQAPDGNTSAARHRSTYFGVFRDAGLDDELAHALWDVDSDMSHNRFAADAADVVSVLRERECAIGVLSNIHFDIRPSFRVPPFDAIGAFVLSHEVGMQKPDPRIFLEMVRRLGTEPGETLMVGDRPSRDGAAAQVGMPTLIVDQLTDPDRRQLGEVTTWPGLFH
ncbi:HAD family hydrolase [Nocardia jejuensis]|uniref:HAD family hydrolase n=1 Tax=Nocardia jejuensis TaxID=328049 RepID=UPI000B09E265|nr:HAD-IA family hydrolase [Nocardia jejuensis]